jgi:hypothetical protein
MYELVTPSESTMYANDKDFDDQESKDDYYDGLGMFEGDPDMLYSNGKDHDSEYVIYFLIDRENHEIIVSEEPETAEEEAFLQAFALGNADLTDDQTWDAVKKEGLFIAYRGGMGYHYTIYQPRKPY